MREMRELAEAQAALFRIGSDDDEELIRANSPPTQHGKSSIAKTLVRRSARRTRRASGEPDFQLLNGTPGSLHLNRFLNKNLTRQSGQRPRCQGVLHKPLRLVVGRRIHLLAFDAQLQGALDIAKSRTSAPVTKWKPGPESRPVRCARRGE
jgi:hypothetical protein